MPNAIAAQQVAERIQNRLGVPWKTPSLDGFQAGAPDTPVKGIATTFAPTMDVLRRAAAAGRNMIISREPAFYNHGSPRKYPPEDPVCAAKQDFIAKHNLVVWRFFENWQARDVDGQLRGLAAALGWDKYRTSGGYFALPPATLARAAREIRGKLKIQCLRVIGDPGTRVSKAALSHGLTPVPALQAMLKEPDVDLVVTGEVVEWEAGPYFEDVIASGRKKGMILLGQEASEEPGSGAVADWLRTFIPEVPVEWISAGEPFWTLK